MRNHPPLSDEIKIKIVERWRYYPLNSIPQLAAEFDCSIPQIDKCINDYLATKIPS
jgi:hypothetical protein